MKFLFRSYLKISKSLSFPNVLVGNPQQMHLGTGPDKAMIGPPTETFGGDRLGINSKAQTLLEYLILIGIVTVVLFAMYHAVKRGIQSVIKITADQIGNQQRADQKEPFLSNAAIVNALGEPVAVSGYLVEAYTATRASNQKEVQELGESNEVGYFYEERVSTNSNSLTNLGFNPRGGN